MSLLRFLWSIIWVCLQRCYFFFYIFYILCYVSSFQFPNKILELVIYVTKFSLLLNRFQVFFFIEVTYSKLMFLWLFLFFIRNIFLNILKMLLTIIVSMNIIYVELVFNWILLFLKFKIFQQFLIIVMLSKTWIIMPRFSNIIFYVMMTLIPSIIKWLCEFFR